VFIGPGDVISLPTKMFRGFTNVGTDTGFLFAVLGGDDPGKVLWAPKVFELAAEHGLVLLETGRLIDKAAGQSVPNDVAVMPATTATQVAALKKATPMMGEGLVWRYEGDTSSAQIIGEDAPLNWPHDFTLDQLKLEVGSLVEMDNIDRPTVLFVQSGHVQISWNIDGLTLGPGDTITVPAKISLSLSSSDGGVIYRVEGQ
jgi:hypothetical protein